MRDVSYLYLSTIISQSRETKSFLRHVCNYCVISAKRLGRESVLRKFILLFGFFVSRCAQKKLSWFPLEKRILERLIMPDNGSKSDANSEDPTSPVDKAGMDGDEDYVKKRERNNIAVRKSRRKAKQRIEETKKRVDDLTKENEDLRIKVALLQKELNVLRSLFANGGVSNGNTLPNGVNVIFTTNSSSTNSTEQSSPQIEVKTEEEVEHD